MRRAVLYPVIHVAILHRHLTKGGDFDAQFLRAGVHGLDCAVFIHTCYVRQMSKEGQQNMLDNRPIAPYFPPSYYAAMMGIAFKQRVAKAMAEKDMTKAELSRLSNVPYHAIDKFLKRDGATTSAENALAISDALEISVDSSEEYDELRSMYERLDEEQKRFVVASVRGLLK